ncbi:hypothetical protein P4V54_09200 [Brevibacillus nitrificans]|uniref:hypothetical protein n=1 Tax=Brevibacillus nitrificans TaxID=651560 RepID=UPI002E1FC117|nr:hypothetical protein [Brevibacillus nitrificans]
MKVTVTSSINQDFQESLAIQINGDKVFSVHDGEPEDNFLSRNFSDCQKIAKLMKLSWEAGLDNEPFEIEYISGGNEQK